MAAESQIEPASDTEDRIAYGFEFQADAGSRATAGD
jgi:hypothetical protein